MTTTQRGLGRGLSALISDNYLQSPATEAVTAANTIHQLPLSRIKPGHYQPRTQFDDIKLAELSESIRKNGVMQPIIVRLRDKESGKYEIIAGERRWRASELAGLKEIPAIIREIDDEKTLELALIENVQRQDLSPLEEAAGYQRLINEFNYSQDVLALTIGKSRSHVANLLRLLALPDEIKMMLDKGELTAGHARALLTAPNPVELAREAIRKGFNVRQTEQYAREVQDKPGKPGAGPKARTQGVAQPIHKDPDIVALEETLSENLGLKVSITDRGQNGEIVISYASLSELDSILQRLGDNSNI